MSSGCEPANRVWYLDLAAIPASPATGALDFSAFDFHAGSCKLPLVKLVDDFKASMQGVLGWSWGCEWVVGCGWMGWGEYESESKGGGME